MLRSIARQATGRSSRLLLRHDVIAKVSLRALSTVAPLEWSGSLSFAGSESDFSSGAVRQHEPEWSNSLSFGSPESDFCAMNQNHETEWSESLSFTSPEADFYQARVPQQETDSLPAWSETLSFTSPEAEFTSAEPLNKYDAEKEWSHGLSFASPEADFCHQDRQVEYNKQDYVHHEEKGDQLRESLATTFTFAGAESDFCSLPMQTAMDDRVKQELLQQQVAESNVASRDLKIPTTLYEALGDATDGRAIAVTQPVAPFRVVAVNDAWVGLCGYSKEEAHDQTLGHMLQGPETNRDAVTHLVQELLHGNQASTVITNYTKSGDRFQNRVKVGPIRDEETHQITHFVGVLQEVQESQDHFTMKQTKMGTA